MRIEPPPFRDDAALGRIWDALPSARVVGGAVRDSLAGRPVADIDLTTPLPPEAVMTALRTAGVRVVPTGLAHGTITATLDGRGFEITTLRRDVQTDGRHAVVAYTGDFREDAARRDFTINAMSMERDGSVFDYFGGVDDLRAGRVRFVGDPVRRIAEDYLRILRFFRFYARYATAAPDRTTIEALRNGVPGLARLSKERVWQELRLILAIPAPDASVALMHRLGVWRAVMPDATRRERLDDLPPDPILRLAAMLTGDPEALAARLKLSNEDRDRLSRLCVTPSVPATADDGTLRRLLADHRKADLVGRTWLDHAPSALRDRIEAMAVPVFPLEGRDVLAIGIPAGREVGALLAAVRRWWLDSGCTADRAACLGELARQAERFKIMPKR
ncbi:MAG TPA: CCA tRNA nucleotidyltransferase [Rhodopila sp.]|uniref:CCA tRNA nucleotidyltransferase n=1 Tax=Rhodopila sp. TaxID=2480087 RepID=UPI002CB63770|nr:CCA tRNA nucleotidyltransferase [Rhodopila sp.]HVY17048.1 CCA tRNA nucleotidyltransferase [Rhodopila sp.]